MDRNEKKQHNGNCKRIKETSAVVFSFFFLFSFLICEARAELRNGMDADVVIGQRDFISNAANQGGNPARNTLSSPRNAFFDGRRLFITENGNNRILVFDGIPKQNNASASLVIGQSSFSANAVSSAASGLDDPHHAVTDGKRLIVADRDNNRVLIFNEFPKRNGASADVAIGQADTMSRGGNNGGLSASSIGDTFGVTEHNGRLFVADRTNHRVLIFNKIPTVSGTAADIVIGQPDFVSNAIDQGGTAGPNTLHQPTMAMTDGERLFIVERSNHRILIFNQIPTKNNVNADVVIGQPDFFSDSFNQGGAPGPNTLGTPTGIFTDGQRLFIAEDGNDRVLIYKSIPTQNNQPADYVLGQADFTSNTGNRGGGPAANTLDGPYGVFYDGRRLFVSERNNHRVLIFNIGEIGITDLGPQFSQGKAVVGKVFWDFNGNGRQNSIKN